MKKGKISKIIPWLLLAGAGVAVFQYFRGKQQQSGPAYATDGTPPVLPPAGNVPSSSSTAPVPSGPLPIMVGKKANANKFASAAFSPFMTTPARYGGTDGKGNFEAGKYAGVVISVNDTAKTALLQNFSTPIKDSTGRSYNQFYMYVKDLNGAY